MQIRDRRIPYMISTQGKVNSSELNVKVYDHLPAPTTAPLVTPSLYNQIYNKANVGISIQPRWICLKSECLFANGRYHSCITE